MGRNKQINRRGQVGRDRPASRLISSIVVQLLRHVLLLGSLGLQPARFLCPWDSVGKNTGVGCHFLLQGIFPTQGLNPASHLQLYSLPLSLEHSWGKGGLIIAQWCYDHGLSCMTNGGKVDIVTDFIFLGCKITADGDCSHEIKVSHCAYSLEEKL